MEVILTFRGGKKVQNHYLRGRVQEFCDDSNKALLIKKRDVDMPVSVSVTIYE